MNILRLFGLVEEAPKDGMSYVRRNGEWVEVPYATESEVNEVVEKALK